MLCVHGVSLPLASFLFSSVREIHLHAVFLFQGLFPLNSDDISPKLKKVIKRCLSRSSTGSDTGKEWGRDASRDGGASSLKEGGKGPSSVSTADAGSEAHALGKKRDRERDKEDGGIRQAKCDRVNPAEAPRAKESKKQADGCKVAKIACDVSAGASVAAHKGQQQPDIAAKSGSGTGAGAPASKLTEASPPSSSTKPPAGGASHSGESRKEGKSEKSDKVSAYGGKDACASRDAGVEGKGAAGAQIGSKAKGTSKDVNGKGGEAGGGGTRLVEAVVDCKAGKGKVGTKRRSGEVAGGAEGRASNGAARSKGAGGEEGEKEETESGEDEGSDAWGRGKKRKSAAKKVVLGEKRKGVISDGDGEHADAPVVPAATRGAMDTESTDSNGISAGGSPASAVGTGGADTTRGADMAGGASSCGAEKEGVVGTLAMNSPSCHGFSEGGKVSSRRVSGRHSQWNLVTLAGAGEDVPNQVRAGQNVCIAFHLRDREGRAVTDEAGLREAHELITFRGHSPDAGTGGGGTSGGDAVWTCGLEPRTKLNKLGGLVCGEFRVMCRTGKYLLRASITPEDGVEEVLAHECAVEVVAGSPSLHRSALSLHLVSGKGPALGSRARNGKHSARAATKPLLMGATSSAGQDVHAEISVETVCDDSGNVLTASPSVVEELAMQLSVTHIHPLFWGEAQNAVAVCEHGAERKSSGEGRLSIEADAENVQVAAAPVPVPSGSTAAATGHRRVRLFTLRPCAPGNHVLLFRGPATPGSDEAEGTLLFHIDLLITKDSAR